MDRAPLSPPGSKGLQEQLPSLERHGGLRLCDVRSHRSLRGHRPTLQVQEVLRRGREGAATRRPPPPA